MRKVIKYKGFGDTYRAEMQGMAKDPQQLLAPATLIFFSLTMLLGQKSKENYLKKSKDFPEDPYPPNFDF